MTFAEVHVKRSVILTDRLGPDILLDILPISKKLDLPVLSILSIRASICSDPV